MPLVKFMKDPGLSYWPYYGARLAGQSTHLHQKQLNGTDLANLVQLIQGL